jgi:hypothetical protein
MGAITVINPSTNPNSTPIPPNRPVVSSVHARKRIDARQAFVGLIGDKEMPGDAGGDAGNDADDDAHEH